MCRLRVRIAFVHGPRGSTMYTVTVERLFVAQHFLTVPNCGDENELHSHAYTARVEARGSSLNEDGYLLDIVKFEDCIEEAVDKYRDVTLNDRDEIQGNPSVERFAHVFAEEVAKGLEAPCVESLKVSMREDDRAWASFEKKV